jgi:hypothetical protein
MSKRKNRKQSPNLPPEMLERARRQLAQQDGVEEEVAEEVEEVAVPPQPEAKAEVVKPAAPAPRAASTRSSASSGRARSNRRSLQPAQSRSERKSDAVDTNYVRNRLLNPTRFVTQEELKKEYGYVITDLRTMGILAAVLLVAMVVIEKLLA